MGKQQDVTLLGTYFAKQLSFGKEEFTTGVRTTHPWWKVSGAWPDDNSHDVLLGERLAAGLGRETGGDGIGLRDAQLRVSGILSTGGAEDDQVVAPLALAQEILGKPGAVRRVYVSALTKPEDALAAAIPKACPAPIYDRWYCSPYPQSIAYQLQEAIPHSHAEQIRQVAQNEGAVLTRIEGLIFLITLAALVCFGAGGLGGHGDSHFRAARRSRTDESSGRGKDRGRVGVFCRSRVAGRIGGLVGFAAGGLLARQIGRSIFNSQIAIPAGTVAGNPGDRGDRDFRRQRGGNSPRSAARSGVRAAR